MYFNTLKLFTPLFKSECSSPLSEGSSSALGSHWDGTEYKTRTAFTRFALRRISMRQQTVVGVCVLLWTKNKGMSYLRPLSHRRHHHPRHCHHHCHRPWQSSVWHSWKQTEERWSLRISTREKPRLSKRVWTPSFLESILICLSKTVKPKDDSINRDMKERSPEWQSIYPRP